MYPLVLLGLLKWTSTVVQKRNSRRELEPKCVPQSLSDFLLLLFVRSFIRFLAPLSRPSFWSIFSDLSSDFFLRFSGPISCSIFCPIVRIPVWYFVRFPVGYLSNFLSDLLSDIIVQFLVGNFVRYFVLFSCPIISRNCLPDLNFSVLENGVNVCERKA